MTRSVRPALLLSLAATSCLVLASGPADAAGWFGRKKPAPAAEAPAPAAVAPPPPVALSGQVVQAAGAYRGYMRRAAAISAGFKDGVTVEAALEKAETSEPLALSRGVVAYAAVLALQEPSFVAGVRRFGVDASQRRQVTERIIADPSYAAQMPGAGAAAALIGRVLRADADKVAAAGAQVKQAAYDVQKSKWSKGDIPDRPGRLARAKSLAATPMSATPEEIAELAASVGAAPGQSRLAAAAAAVPGETVSPPFTATVVRGLAVAALAALGQAGEDNDAAVQVILNDASGSYCHNMAKLNLYQCLAVAKPFYEDVFCLGQHVLIDTGQCVAKGAGVAPLAAAGVSDARAAAPPASLGDR